MTPTLSCGHMKREREMQLALAINVALLENGGQFTKIALWAHVTICVETLRIDSGCSLEKEFTKLIPI